jgi:hypothetical protein
MATCSADGDAIDLTADDGADRTGCTICAADNEAAANLEQQLSEVEAELSDVRGLVCNGDACRLPVSRAPHPLIGELHPLHHPSSAW